MNISPIKNTQSFGMGLKAAEVLDKVSRESPVELTEKVQKYFKKIHAKSNWQKVDVHLDLDGGNIVTKFVDKKGGAIRQDPKLTISFDDLGKRIRRFKNSIVAHCKTEHKRLKSVAKMSKKYAAKK